MCDIQQLAQRCVIESDRWGSSGTHILIFEFHRGATTIRIVLDDYSGADMIITNMTTLPRWRRREGRGHYALKILLQWALANSLYDIRAVQVQKESEEFWVKNGFIALNNGTNDFVYKNNN